MARDARELSRMDGARAFGIEATICVQASAFVRCTSRVGGVTQAETATEKLGPSFAQQLTMTSAGVRQIRSAPVIAMPYATAA